MTVAKKVIEEEEEFRREECLRMPMIHLIQTETWAEVTRLEADTPVCLKTDYT
jgi:hypothetical protein